MVEKGLPETTAKLALKRPAYQSRGQSVIAWQTQSVTSSSKASVSMSSQSNPVIEGARVVVRAEPGKTPLLAEVALGGTLKFENHFPDFPDFEIEFDPPGPPSASDKLTGTVHEPIFVHMPDTDVTFHYHIVYKKKDGTTRDKRGPFRARSCGGCPSNG